MSSRLRKRARRYEDRRIDEILRRFRAPYSAFSVDEGKTWRRIRLMTAAANSHALPRRLP